MRLAGLGGGGGKFQLQTSSVRATPELVLNAWIRS